MKLTATQLRDFSATILAMTSQEELRQLNQMIIQRSRTLQNRVISAAKANIQVGGKVEWNSRSMGQRMTGVVQKVNPKNVVVKETTTGQLWNVTATLLKPL